MWIKVNNLSLDIEEDMSVLKEKAAKKLKIKESEIKKFRICKESIDARKKNNIKFNYCVDITCDNMEKVVKRANSNDVKIEDIKYNAEIKFGSEKLNTRPIIVGMGPAGLFAGLIMAQKGYKPIILERGEDVEKRTETVNKFWENGVMNVNSNVQFGEGGAGTFSDGKLTTRIKDYRCGYVLEELVKAGAPEEILYMAKPHVGTDILKNVVKTIREKIIELGGEVRFKSKVEDIIIKDNKVKEVVVNKERIPCEVLILAIGHSARDTYEMLFKRGVFMAPKPFAIGFRVEHPQDLINENQYGKYKNHQRLKAAEYKLTYTAKSTNRGVYSFCMCPGGHVVAAASEENTVVVNGMSNYKRDNINANSAIVVSVGPDDFNSDSPIAGIEFQRKYEKLAFEVGGRNYNAPAQLVEDFLKDKKSTKLKGVTPTYAPGIEFSNLNQCMPKYVVDSIKEAMPVFNRRINGFAEGGAIFTGVETRTSAPVRIGRNEENVSISTVGLYPAGEGAGYAGGIISAAVDGLKIAESIMEKYKNLN
ncbi:MAG: NAD(P)/FAD-dependent oxidoreductase [Clostridium sp.]